MKYALEGDKGIFLMGDGRPYPGVLMDDSWVEDYTISTGEVIQIHKANVITKRETNPANGPVRTYYVPSEETLQFGRKPQAFRRRDDIIGLDVTEEGALISLDELTQFVVESASEFAATNFAARANGTKVSELTS